MILLRYHYIQYHYVEISCEDGRSDTIAIKHEWEKSVMVI